MQETKLMLQVVAQAALESNSNVPELVSFDTLTSAAAHLLQQCATYDILSEAERPVPKM